MVWAPEWLIWPCSYGLKTARWLFVFIRNSFDSAVGSRRWMNKIHHRHSLTRTHTAHVVTHALHAEPVCQLCQLIINEINSCVRPGGPKNFMKQGPTGKSPGFPVGQSATARKLYAKGTADVVAGVYWFKACKREASWGRVCVRKQVHCRHYSSITRAGSWPLCGKKWKFFARNLQILRAIFVNSALILHTFVSRFFHINVISGSSFDVACGHCRR